MKYLALCVLIFSLPCFAVEYNIGVAGIAGISLSRWSGEFRNYEGVFITDHLDSRAPVYQAGLGISMWLTERIGMYAGMQYGWYNYKYAYGAASGTIESRWKCTNLLIPIEIMYGIAVGANKLTIGGGLVVCRQLNCLMPSLDDVPDSLLETTVGPQVSFGYEIKSGRTRIFPSFRYVYGIDGLSDQLLPVGDNISKHYFLLGLGMFYRL